MNITDGKNIFHYFNTKRVRFECIRLFGSADNKYLTISFQYLPGEETRLFSRNDPSPVTEKAGFLRCSRKKDV
ncbi:Uncharacterized protein dnm_025150 [Desulfonema magnum]|uniref:Uncharacterized protein n=1 Tax=Desulfonema magnum TaxID=45655 RepID=A0A975BJM7_9BACT|nr:Uncharacterized protein dnm_025150 [Desulfonema magnum]